jgi:hypothetical protein
VLVSFDPRRTIRCGFSIRPCWAYRPHGQRRSTRQEPSRPPLCPRTRYTLPAAGAEGCSAGLPASGRRGENPRMGAGVRRARRLFRRAEVDPDGRGDRRADPTQLCDQTRGVGQRPRPQPSETGKPLTTDSTSNPGAAAPYLNYPRWGSSIDLRLRGCRRRGLRGALGASELASNDSASACPPTRYMPIAHSHSPRPQLTRAARSSEAARQAGESQARDAPLLGSVSLRGCHEVRVCSRSARRADNGPHTHVLAGVT